MEYLAFYKDEIKGELLKFKNNNNIAVERWLKMVSEEHLESFPKIDYIVRALGSSETEVTFTPLDKVGQLLASKLGAMYIPKLLNKKQTQQLKFLNRHERKLAIKNSYSCIDKLDIDRNASILIIDDVITTGATGNEIATVLKKTYGSQLKISHFALVYTPLRQQYLMAEQQYNQDFYKKLMAA
jgi:predicted amidophosphoribosyltransferase